MKASSRMAAAVATLAFGAWLGAAAPSSASPVLGGGGGDPVGESCEASDCYNWNPERQKHRVSSNFPGTMKIARPMFYADLPEAGPEASGPSPGEGLLSVALILFMGFAAKFRSLII